VTKAYYVTGFDGINWKVDLFSPCSLISYYNTAQLPYLLFQNRSTPRKEATALINQNKKYVGFWKGSTV